MKTKIFKSAFPLVRSWATGTPLRSGMKRVLGGLLVLTLSLMVVVPMAEATTQNLAWVGDNAYAMKGTFSYEHSLIGTGLIDETQINTLMIEGFQHGASVGTWHLADGLGGGALPFNVNFDATTNLFSVGGTTSSATGQAWNANANPGFGFASGNAEQGLFLDGANLFGGNVIFADFPSTLIVGTHTQSAFNIDWIGNNGYTMTGMFSYWDAFGGGVIDERHLTSLMIEGFQNGTSLGTWDWANEQGPGALPFAFNFDTTSNTFVIGGSGLSQAWNADSNPGFGFASGNAEQGLFLDGANLFGGNVIFANSRYTLTATPKNGTNPLPDPSTMLLVVSGLLGYRWKKAQA